MNCNRCGSPLEPNATFCTSCGNQVAPIPNQQENNQINNAPTEVPNVNPMGAPINNMQNYNNAPIYNGQTNTPAKANVGLVILSVLFPVIGLILFLVNKDKDPKTAKACGIAALVVFIINVVFVILFNTIIWNRIKSNIIQSSGINEIIDEEYKLEDKLEDKAEAKEDKKENDTVNAAGTSDVNTSTNWKNYEISYNGKTLKLPCTYSELSNITGLEMSEDDSVLTLPKNKYTYVTLKKNNRSALTIDISNPTEDAINIKDGIVTRLSFDSYNHKNDADTVAVFPGGLQVGQEMTEDQLKSLFGEPDNRSEYNSDSGDYHTITYKYQEDEIWSTRDYYEIKILNGVIDELKLDNLSKAFQ